MTEKPPSGGASTVTVPWWAWAIARTIERPRPRPPSLLVLVPSPRTKGSRRRRASPDGVRRPVLAIRSSVRPFAGPGPGLAAGEEEQAVENVLHVVDGVAHVLGHGDELAAVGVPVEGDVDGGPGGGQGGAQFVCSVGSEQALALEDAVAVVDAVLDAVEHAVNGVGERGELIGGGGDRDAFGEVLGGEPLCGGGDRAEGPQDAPGEEPAEDRGQRGDREEGEAGPGEERGEGLGLEPVGEGVEVLHGRGCEAAVPSSIWVKNERWRRFSRVSR